MTYEQLQPIVPFVAAAFFGLAIIVFVLSVRFFRKSRTDFYWRRRRAAGQRGWRLFLWSIVLSLVSGLICMAAGVAGLIYSHPTPIINFITPTSISVAALPSSTSGPSTESATADAALSATSAPTDTEIPTSNPVSTEAATDSVMTVATASALEASTNELSALAVGATGTAASAMLATTTRATITSTVIPQATLTTSVKASSTPTTAPSLTLVPSPTVGTPSPTGPTPTRTVTSSPAPSQTPSVTSSPTATATATVSPTITSTPTETLVPALLDTVSLDSSVTPDSNAMLTITSIDTQVTSDGAPVSPATTFKAGFNRIFFFITFSGMQSGVLWRRDLLYNDKVVQSNSYLWGMAGDGTAFFFFGQEGGFKAGKYEIRLYIGQAADPTASISFTVT